MTSVNNIHSSYHNKLARNRFRILMYGKTPKRAFNAFALSGRVFKIGIKSATVFVAFQVARNALQKNASTNGGDASRVGLIKRKDTNHTK